MRLKQYQTETLAALRRFCEDAAARGPAAAFAAEIARQEAEAAARGEVLPARAYQPFDADPELPHVCLRLPTGGGKTLLAAEAIPLAGRALMGRDRPLALWLVPSKAIKTQTLEALSDPRHPYRRRLDEVTGGRVRVFDVEAFETITPADLAATTVVVSTIAAFRATDTTGRRLYRHHEMMAPHFAGLPTEGMERTTEADAERTMGMPVELVAGRVKHSFANLLHHHRPLMIVDEAHNAVTGLSREMQARLNPSAILEFTATPTGRSNVLHSVTASALKAEEMIKLPIRVQPHGDWKGAVDATVATRHALEEKAAGEAEHLRPVALYQAQSKDGHPTVEELRAYLLETKLIDAGRIKVATGEQRELDGVDLSDPAEQTRHVITVQALKEGWDCPSAYVLCATQRLTASTAIEQLLGRVLRMPYAKRRAHEALNVAYAHVSEPRFADAVAALLPKLIGMGFTDEEIHAGVRPGGMPRGDDGQGDFFDDDPVDPKPVYNFEIAEEAIAGVLSNVPQEDWEVAPTTDGRVKVGLRGGVPEGVAAAIVADAPDERRAIIRAGIDKHNAAVSARRSPAERGEAIDVPWLLAAMDGDVFRASADAIMERTDWSLADRPARLSEEDIAFRADAEVVEIDLDGERLTYTRETRAGPELRGFGAVPVAGLEASLVGWLERACRTVDMPASDLRPWLAALVADLTGRRGIDVRTLIDWQHRLAQVVRAKIDAARADVRDAAFQRVLFDAPVPRPDAAPVLRFDASSYRDVPTRSLGAMRLTRHLLGPDRAPLMDGKIDGEEFQCALTLDGLEQVAVWTRNVAKHRDSFWLPRSNGHRFFPDFVARLTDGRILVIEYKGAYLVTAQEAREKDTLGRLWAEATGQAFVMATKGDLRAQIIACLSDA